MRRISRPFIAVSPGNRYSPLALIVKLAGCGVDGDFNVVAGMITAFLDRLYDRLQHFLGIFKIWGKSSSSPTAVLVSALI